MHVREDNHTWHLIVNPKAGRGKVQKIWPDIESALQACNIPYSVKFTEYAGHAVRLVDDIVLRGGRNIMGVGGDGTNHDIINGIMQQTWAPPASIRYTLMPGGTGNDWARMYEIPADPLARMRKLLSGATAWQDIGQIEYVKNGETGSRYFVNVAGLAYDGFIGEKLSKNPVKNKADYLFRVAQYLFEYEPSKALLEFDGQSVENRFYTINIGLCKYSAGGMQLVPQAIADDGLFALTYALSMPKLEVLLQTARFYNGSLLQHPKVTGVQAREIQVNHAPGMPPLLIEADGEYLGQTPVKFTLFEKALQVAL
ncbi:MAG: diacylglycerol kinase family lipid kinase [Saprospiraceae bacterium]|nr:diacylglycerol kinase family lipid kinase [Saprospiraceae bacterium]